MELDDFKSSWQSDTSPPKSSSEIQSMTQLHTHPTMKRIKIKLILELIGISFFALIYWDAFDGNLKPLAANIALGIGILAFLSNQVIGLVVLFKPIQGSNLLLSSENYLNKLRNYARASLLATVLFNGCLFYFFFSIIDFTPQKVLILVGICIVFMGMLYLHSFVWRKHLNQLKQVIDELNA
ncbi:MAG: hypothetical protein ACPGJS_19705 [Flammeovirgaceae bacterium]